MNSAESVAPGTMPWFGLRVRSRSEPMTTALLEGKGYAPFFPAYNVSRQWTDRIRQVDTPLFPGYLFCRLDSQKILPILTTPGVLGVVGFGKVPAPIDEQEIDAIRAVVTAGLPAQSWPFTREGDEVSIVAGPLRGVRGIVNTLKNDRHLILSITMLQRSVSVEVDLNWVRRVNQAA